VKSLERKPSVHLEQPPPWNKGNMQVSSVCAEFIPVKFWNFCVITYTNCVCICFLPCLVCFAFYEGFRSPTFGHQLFILF